jgi:RNA methyltransferase, TrmH family
VTALAASNPRIRRLRRLSGRRSARHDEGAFVLEGPTLVAEALSVGAPVEAVFVESGEVPELVDAARGAGVEVHEVEPGVIAGITDSVTPRPVLATVAIARSEPDAVLADALEARRPVLLLVEVADPGNLGTILRAADAAGCAGVMCSLGTVDPWSPKTVRASAGAVLHVPVAVDVDAADMLVRASASGLPSAATVIAGGAPLDEVDLSGPSMLVLGSEAHGLPAGLLDLVDVPLTIPMEGRAESLNVAMAASVLVFEAMRQRRGRGSASGGSADARLDGPAAEPIGRLDPSTTQ